MTLPRKRITMKSPKDIAKSRFYGGWFLCTIFRWA
nr:MAG TPA: signaling protein [Caudoviricetes sp.]